MLSPVATWGSLLRQAAEAGLKLLTQSTHQRERPVQRPVPSRPSTSRAETHRPSTGGARTALGLLGYALARAGREPEARGILSDMLAGRAESHGSFGIALVYTGLRDYDRAFAWLEKAVQERSVRVYIMDPLFEDLQRDPRFDRLRLAGGIS